MVALKRIMQAPMVRLLSIVLRLTYPQQYPTRIMGPNGAHKYRDAHSEYAAEVEQEAQAT